MTEQKALDIAVSQLLEPAELNLSAAQTSLGKLMGRAVDFADLYFQHSRFESFALEDGKVKEGVHTIEQGVGARALAGEATGFAYSEELSVSALTDAVGAARAISRQGGDGAVAKLDTLPSHQLYAPIDPLVSWPDDRKVALLHRLDEEARREDSRVEQVMTSLSGSFDVVLIVGSDGTLAADIRPLVRLNVTVIMADGERREQGFAGGGARAGYELFEAPELASGYVREAVRQAAVNMEAVAAPAGTMPVVLGPGWPGVLLHEAIGHGLEGDFNRKRTSAFAGRIGELVASPLCTVLDDGTLPGRRGSLGVDDEGTPTQATTLIENGVLKGYLQDRQNAHLMGVEPTGNGRRESFAHVPMPRMTNTYMLAGDSDPDEIIASVERGLYAPNFGGGQVDITSGQFVFSASEAYLIENGRLGAPVRGAMLIGDGPSVLKSVSMVGNDLALDTGVGVCGKDGQSVPVGVGQPTLKLDELTVGGTQA